MSPGVCLIPRYAMRQEAPGGGVPLRREEVSPVLPDEPGAEEGRGLRAVGQFPESGDPAHQEHRQHAEPERELVDAEPAEVDARTKVMAFQAYDAAEGRHGVRVETMS